MTSVEAPPRPSLSHGAHRPPQNHSARATPPDNLADLIIHLLN